MLLLYTTPLLLMFVFAMAAIVSSRPPLSHKKFWILTIVTITPVLNIIGVIAFIAYSLCGDKIQLWLSSFIYKE